MEYQVLEQLKTFKTVTEKNKIVSKVQSAKYWSMYIKLRVMIPREVLGERTFFLQAHACPGLSLTHQIIHAQDCSVFGI